MPALAASWTIDMRDNMEANSTVYLKAGEQIDVLLGGTHGTGYRWISNIGYAKMKQEYGSEKDVSARQAHVGHIGVIDEADYEDPSHRESEIYFMDEEDNVFLSKEQLQPGKEYVSIQASEDLPLMLGSNQAAWKYSFSTD